MIKAKNLVATLLILGLVALVGPAFGELCTVDAVPAATLLLPYFEVDLDACGSADQSTTIFSINNASAAPALAHVTVWTDWSQPTLDFDVFLTGYDVQSVNLADLFCDGNIPITADEANDDDDDISPNNGHPTWDGSFPNCDTIFPFYNNPMVTGSRYADLVAAHTGQEVGGGDCTGADHGDNIARGYITIDNANACSLIFPGDTGYFNDGVDAGIASDINQLWGDWFLVDGANNFAQGDNLVHVEAGDPSPWQPLPNDYTFYARYTSVTGEFDNREPLGETWGARYLNGGAFDQSQYIVWRDSTSAQSGDYDCGAPGTPGVGPDWHPLNETQVIAFNEQEDAAELCFAGPGGVISPPEPGTDDTCFPLETQRVSVGDAPLDPPFNFGWMYANLNVGIDSPTQDYDPATYEGGSQSYFTVVHSALGRYSVGYQAIELSSACDLTNGLIVDW